MKTIVIEKNCNYRLYLTNNGELGLMAYSNGELFVMFDLDIKDIVNSRVTDIAITPLACYRFKTKRSVKPDRWVNTEILDDIRTAVMNFLN